MVGAGAICGVQRLEDVVDGLTLCPHAEAVQPSAGICDYVNLYWHLGRAARCPGTSHAGWMAAGDEKRLHCIVGRACRALPRPLQRATLAVTAVAAGPKIGIGTIP